MTQQPDPFFQPVSAMELARFAGGTNFYAIARIEPGSRSVFRCGSGYIGCALGWGHNE